VAANVLTGEFFTNKDTKQQQLGGLSVAVLVEVDVPVRVTRSTW